MNKRKLHHYWTRLRPLRHWYFLILAVVFLVVGLYGLRQNNLTALRLRDEVLTADKNNGDVEGALRELRQYVHSHMNTDLSSGPTAIKPSIQLKYRYERLLEEEKAKTSARNARIYTDAQAECERRFPAGLGGAGRIPCIEAYVARAGVKAQSIPDDLYKFEFASPRWSFDMAGISLLLAGLFFMLFLLRFALELWLKRQLE